MSYFYFRIMWRDTVIEQHSLILTIDVMVYSHHTYQDETLTIRVITKLSNTEQFYKGEVKTHKYINRHDTLYGGNSLTNTLVNVTDKINIKNSNTTMGHTLIPNRQIT